MRSAIRCGQVVIVLCAAVAGLYEFVYLPYRCNAAEHEIVLLTASPATHDAAVIVARENLRLIRTYRDRYPTVGLLFQEGVSLQTIGYAEQAQASFREAIYLEPRAEIFRSLGDAQLEANTPDTAYVSLFIAGTFHLSYVLDLPHEDLKSRLIADVKRPDAEARALRYWNELEQR